MSSVANAAVGRAGLLSRNQADTDETEAAGVAGQGIDWNTKRSTAVKIKKLFALNRQHFVGGYRELTLK